LSLFVQQPPLHSWLGASSQSACCEPTKALCSSDRTACDPCLVTVAMYLTFLYSWQRLVGNGQEMDTFGKEEGVVWFLCLNGEVLSCYSNKIPQLYLGKYPYYHRLTNKAYLSAIKVTNICQSSTYRMAAKINWHRYRTKLRHCHRMYRWGRRLCFRLFVPALCRRHSRIPASLPWTSSLSKP